MLLGIFHTFLSLLDINGHVKLGHSVDGGYIVSNYNRLFGVALLHRYIVPAEILNGPDRLKLHVVLHNIVPQAHTASGIIGNLANVLLAKQNGNIIGDLIQNPDRLIAGKIG